MYNHQEIEKKWQKHWKDNNTFKTSNTSLKPKYYCLDMFPYPSGAGLHVGHPEGMTANDIVARYKHAKGHNVLHPMGWDAFGLPAENYAIKTGKNPRITTDENIATFKRQIQELGFSYDWEREIDTTDPEYFKWTQWIFLKLFEAGLAYEQDLPINYCPSCKTGLANEEVLGDFSCERCGTQVEKKKIRQWVLAITKYAERLLSDVDDLDWPEGIKDMQRNWIGKSEGCEFEMKKAPPQSPSTKGEANPGEQGESSIRVYTTRVDTVFGMTYAVIAPDHADVHDFIESSHYDECMSYIKKASQQSDQDRTADDKEKTGVFTGSYVINPYNGEQVPLWIADYVLGSYGTGAVMAVPAHDIRDFEFAKKYDLEVKQSIAKIFTDTSGDYAPRRDKKDEERDLILGIVRNPKTREYLCLEWKKTTWRSFITGGTDGEDGEKAAKREIYEETGYKNLKFIESLGKTRGYHFAAHKDVNRIGNMECLLFELLDEERVEISENERTKHDIHWIHEEEVKNYINLKNNIYSWNRIFKKEAITDYGILVNSGEYNGLTSEEAKEKFAQLAEEKGFGHKKTNYKLRDWLFSRQRYWGEPIPLIHVESDDIKALPRVTSLEDTMESGKAYVLKQTPLPNPLLSGEGTDLSMQDAASSLLAGENGERCLDGLDSRTLCSKGQEKSLVIDGKIVSKIYSGIYSDILCDYELPLKLPAVEAYEPAGDGTSPLTKVDDFVNVQLADNLSGKRETNTMPQWGGSCWYYLRFMDAKNPENLVGSTVEKYWGNVDSYVGGAEHAVLHLLYARFWHKFLFDIGVVSTSEPFHRLRNQGMILGMSYRNSAGRLIANDMMEEKDGKYFDIETGEQLEKIPAKMSKSLKNVINPDDIVEQYGADTLRMYEMYMADFKDAAPWDTSSIVGVRRFLDKFHSMVIEGNKRPAKSDDEAMKMLHKTIKKVEIDIENYKFNTAIAQMMILLNTGEPVDPEKNLEWKCAFVQLLHPFAPHMAEECWEELSKRPVSQETGLGEQGFEKIYFATGNTSKIERAQKLLSRLNPNAVVEKYSEIIDVEETGKTSLECALQKLEVYKGKDIDAPIVVADTEVHFEDADFDFEPTKVKRTALEIAGKKESDLSVEEVAELMIAYYQDKAQKAGGKLNYHYVDSWAVLYPNGEVKTFEYRREYILTDTREGELKPYFPMANLYVSKYTGKRHHESTDEDFFVEFAGQMEAMAELFGYQGDSIFFTSWPEYDEAMTVDNEVTIGVQVLGKLRGEIKIAVGEDKDSVLEKAKSVESVAKWLEGKTLVKEIYVPGKIVNLVVK